MNNQNDGCPIISASLPISIRMLLEFAKCNAKGRNASTLSYYVDVTTPDNRCITLRDADHGGFGGWNGQGDVPLVRGTIYLTISKKNRTKLAFLELAKWLNVNVPRNLNVHSVRSLKKFFWP